MHWASYMGYCQLVVELVKCGGDLKAISEDGWTPLQLAVHKNNLEGFVKFILSFLIENFGSRQDDFKRSKDCRD